MKNIIFIAPPAAGKGTQSDLLVKKYGYSHISTGDLLRNEINNKSEIGLKIESIMAKGDLVSDEIITELLDINLSKLESQNGIILDGYPRTINQAVTLNELLNKHNMNNVVVLYLDMDLETAMSRALGRVTCSKCGRGYNKYIDSLKSKVDGICDNCSSELISRSDDNEESFKVRYSTYQENAKPLLDFYEKMSILNVVDNNGTPEETFKNIEGLIND